MDCRDAVPFLVVTKLLNPDISRHCRRLSSHPRRAHKTHKWSGGSGAPVPILGSGDEGAAGQT
jgi:hypothetical protein